MRLVDIIVKAGLAKSKTEARKAIENKGIKLHNFLILDPNTEIFLYDDLWLVQEFNRLTTINPQDNIIKTVEIDSELN